MTPDPWTLYWQTDRLDSVDAIRSAGDADAIRAYWAELALSMIPGASVLDLATGNGTVPSALLSANAELQVTGVDQADIDPMRFLSSPGELAAADFQSNTDICSLPFDDSVFDAVTSQFGIEYAPANAAFGEAVRVLATGGELRLLMHHAASGIVEPAAIRQREMEALLADEGVLQILRALVKGQATEADLEAAGQAFVASEVTPTPGIGGQIFQGVNGVIEFLQNHDRRAGAELCETMLLRLTADSARLRQLQNAALTQQDFEETVTRLEAAGVSTAEAAALHANVNGDDAFVFGWRYSGNKT